MTKQEERLGLCNATNRSFNLVHNVQSIAFMSICMSGDNVHYS